MEETINKRTKKTLETSLQNKIKGGIKMKKQKLDVEVYGSNATVFYYVAEGNIYTHNIDLLPPSYYLDCFDNYDEAYSGVREDIENELIESLKIDLSAVDGFRKVVDTLMIYVSNKIANHFD